MTEREIRQVREQWDKAHSRWSLMCRVLEEMRDKPNSIGCEPCPTALAPAVSPDLSSLTFPRPSALLCGPSTIPRRHRHGNAPGTR